ncbi:MAG: hypothetical protein ACT443_13075 [Gemmatimonadota bacterium]
MSRSTGTPERMALSTELSEFLVEFSIALHRTSMYPAGHPSQDRSAGGVVQRLATLLADRASVSIGVARRQLVIEGVATDPRHPVLCSLAEKFHRQHIGAVVFQRGVSTREVVDMMQLVAVEAERGERPLGLGGPEVLQRWDCLRLYPLTYDQLELVGDSADVDDTADDEQREQGTRSAQLWIGLARAALAAEERDAEPESTDPTVVAHAINEHPQAQAYDQVIVGYLLQLAEELKRDGGAGSSAVRRRMSRLIGALDPGTLGRLVEMGGSLAQRRQFALDATESLAADAVVEIVRAAAASSGQTISSSLVRMLSKLSAFAEQGTQTPLQAQADTALREQVRELVQGWSLADPNPDAYTRALQSLSLGAADENRVDDTHAPEPIRIVQMAIEVEAVGVPFWRAVAALEDAGALADLVATLQDTPAGNLVARQLWEHLATESNIRALLGRDHVDFHALGALLDRIDSPLATAILLDALTQSESRATRMGVFRRLVATGARAAAALSARLTDSRWYVQRNVLAILNEIGHVPDSFAPAEFARHADARVRREALTMWLRIEIERDRAVVAGLKDTDDRAFRIALAAAVKHGVPDAALPIIATRLGDRALAADLQPQLVRALGQSRSLLAVDTLLRVVVAGKTLFGAPRLAEPTPAMLTALAALAERWSHDARVKPVLSRARAARHTEIAAALARGEAAR